MIAATEAEIAPVLSLLKEAGKEDAVKIVITGIGIAATSFALGSILSDVYSLAIQAGVGGAISRELRPGEVVVVTEDEFYGFGAENHSDFLSVFDLGLVNKDERPFKGGVLNGMDGNQFPVLRNLRRCKGITVQTVHGSEESIQKMRSRNPFAQVESMEGAAAFYACGKSGLSCLQIRAISNYVEPRNREAWKLKEAIDSLNGTIIDILQNCNLNFSV